MSGKELTPQVFHWHDKKRNICKENKGGSCVQDTVRVEALFGCVHYIPILLCRHALENDHERDDDGADPDKGLVAIDEGFEAVGLAFENSSIES